jgi:hypothetical protein
MMLRIRKVELDKIVVDFEGHRIAWWEDLVFLNGRSVSHFHPLVVMARRQYIRVRARDPR